MDQAFGWALRSALPASQNSILREAGLVLEAGGRAQGMGGGKRSHRHAAFPPLQEEK